MFCSACADIDCTMFISGRMKIVALDVKGLRFLQNL